MDLWNGLDLTSPFTRQKALAHGLSSRELADPQIRRLMHDTYVAAHVPDTIVVRCRGARLHLPDDAVFSHHTAMRLWAPSYPWNSALHVSFSRDVRPRKLGLRPHLFSYPLDRRYRHGLPVTSPELTFVHLAVEKDLVDLVGVGDKLVARGVTSPADLMAYAERWSGHGAVPAREAARLVRAGVDSTMESTTRMLIVLAGLPEPTVDHHLCDVDGVVRYRLDLAVPEVRLAIEYDGRWHERPEQQKKDTVRRATLALEGWRFLVITADDIFLRPENTLLRIAKAMREVGLVVPGELDDEYRRYFEASRPAEWSTTPQL